VFLSARTVRSGGIQHLVVILIPPDAQNAMELMIQNITEKKHGIAWITRKQIEQPPKKVSYALMFSSVLTAKGTIKWTAIVVPIGVTISTGIGMVENNRNSFKSRVQ